MRVSHRQSSSIFGGAPDGAIAYCCLLHLPPNLFSLMSHSALPRTPPPCLPAPGKLMGQLHDRNCRRAFAPAEAFQADALPADRFQSEMSAATAAGRALSEGALLGNGSSSGGGGGSGSAGGAGRAWGLLAHAPYLVPFRERARLFQSVVAAERARHRDMEVMHSLAAAEFGGPGNRFFAVRRTQVCGCRSRAVGHVSARMAG